MTSSTSNIFTKEFGSLDYTTSDNVKLLIQTHWKSKENEIDSLDIIIVSNNVVWKASVS